MSESRSYTVGIVLTVVVVVLTVAIVIYLITRYDYSINGTLPFVSGATVRIRSLATGSYLYTDGNNVYNTGTISNNNGVFILTQQTAANSQGYYTLTPALYRNVYLSVNCNSSPLELIFGPDASRAVQLQFNLVSAYRPTQGSPIQAGIGSAYQIVLASTPCGEQLVIVSGLAGDAVYAQQSSNAPIFTELFSVQLA